MPPTEKPTHVSLPGQLSPWRDISIVIAATLCAALISTWLEINEWLFSLTRSWEHLQLDELPIVLVVLAIGLMWLSWRRYRQACIQLQAREAAEERLSRALAVNRELTHQHLAIQESERKTLARELHDELGQYLNAIKIDAVTLHEPLESEAARAVSERIVTSVDHVHGVLSDMIRRLRPAGLDELGLVAALENCLDHWRQRLPGKTFSLHARGVFDGLPELTNLTLYRLVQEGLTNCHKHSGADRVEVMLACTGHNEGHLILSVTDNGRGASASSGRGGFGLRGMRERVEMMGGEFTVESVPGKGFSFVARLPATVSS